MATYQEIVQQINALQKQAEEIKAREQAAVIADIRQKIEQYGLTADDLGFGAKPVAGKKASRKVPVRYRDNAGNRLDRSRQAPGLADPGPGRRQAGRGLPDPLSSDRLAPAWQLLVPRRQQRRPGCRPGCRDHAQTRRRVHANGRGAAFPFRGTARAPGQRSPAFVLCFSARDYAGAYRLRPLREKPCRWHSGAGKPERIHRLPAPRVGTHPLDIMARTPPQQISRQ